MYTVRINRQMLSVKYIERKSYKRERRDSNISHDFTRNKIHVHYNRPSYQTASQWLIVTHVNTSMIHQIWELKGLSAYSVRLYGGYMHASYADYKKNLEFPIHGVLDKSRNNTV